MSLHTISAQILTDDISVHASLLVDLADATCGRQSADTFQGWVAKCDVPCVVIQLQSC